MASSTGSEERRSNRAAGDGGRILAVLALLYVAAASFGLWLAPAAVEPAAFLPATGVLAGALAFSGATARRGLLVGAFIASLIVALIGGAAATQALILAFIAPLSGLLFLGVGRLIGWTFQLRVPTDMIRLVLTSAFAAAAAAVTTATGLALIADAAASPADWPAWFLGYFTGLIALTPLVIGARDPAPVRRMTVEIAAVVAAGTTVTAIAYTPLFGPDWPQITPLAFATPFVLWCAVRGSVFANALHSVALSLIAILVLSPAIGAELGRGAPAPDLILATQLFILRVCGSSLLLSILFEERRRSELHLRTIIDTVPVGLILAEAQTGRVLEVNGQVERLLRHEVPRATAAGGGAPGARLPWAAMIEAAEESAPLDVHYRRGDGSQAWLRLLGRPVKGHDGDVIGSVVAIVDIDEERKAWDRIQAEVDTLQARLIHSSRVSAMGTMASAIAHELNQPLAAISNYLNGAARLVRDGTDGGDTQSLVETAIDRAESCAARAGQILTRLRRMVSRETVGLEPARVGELIDTSLQMTLMGVPAEGVVWQLRSLPGVRVKVDPIQIQQVLINLIGNAIEAVRGMDAALVELAVEQDGAMVRIDVIDNGPGFAPEVMATLFEPFVSTKKDGLGVGLSICRTIVEMHGGRIQVAREGERTRVSVTLPVYEANVEALAQAA
jgi:signal transduction histidine kinase